MTELVSIILAAGEGTRMRSSIPKVLHPVGGLPIIGHVVNAAVAAGSTSVGVVTGPGHQSVRDMVGELFPKAQFFEQTERRGTAHAARMARPLWEGAEGYVAVVYGDHPMLRASNFKLVTDRLDAGMDAAILGFIPAASSPMAKSCWRSASTRMRPPKSARSASAMPASSPSAPPSLRP